MTSTQERASGMEESLRSSKGAILGDLKINPKYFQPSMTWGGVTTPTYTLTSLPTTATSYSAAMFATPTITTSNA